MGARGAAQSRSEVPQVEAASYRRPLLFQVNTRVLLAERARALGRPATLDDVPDALLDDLGRQGSTGSGSSASGRPGPAARRSRAPRADWRGELRATLPDLTRRGHHRLAVRDPGYDVAPRLRRRRGAGAAPRRGSRGAGSSCCWTSSPTTSAPITLGRRSHPEYFIEGTEDGPRARAAELQPWPTGAAGRRPRLRARSRTSPAGPTRCSSTTATPGCARRCWASWPGRRALRRRALRHGHAGAAGRVPSAPGAIGPCRATARRRGPPFWPDAIGARRARAARGSCSWPRSTGTWSGTLQQQGFDFTYDKRLYDRLRAGDARPVREHLWRRPSSRTARRASSRTTTSRGRRRPSPPATHIGPRRSITFLSPGLRFFHEGQLEGRTGARLDAPRPRGRSSRADRELRRLLRPAAGRAAAPRGARRHVAAARVPRRHGTATRPRTVHRLGMGAGEAGCSRW